MEKQYIIEASLENVEAVIDTLTDNELLTSIPVVGTAVKLIKGAADIRDRIFAAKIAKFLESFESASAEAKEKIREKVATSPEEAKKVGETVLLILDRMSDIDKADLIAKVFIAYIFGHLKADDFRRICEAVDHAFLDDLIRFTTTPKLPKKSKEPFMRNLAHTGLTISEGGKTFDEAGDIYYEVSPLGNKLINACHHGRKYIG